MFELPMGYDEEADDIIHHFDTDRNLSGSRTNTDQLISLRDIITNVNNGNEMVKVEVRVFEEIEEVYVAQEVV